MKITTTTATEQQFLNHDSTSSLTESSFEDWNNMEFELESILLEEFAQGLPNDLDNAGF